jgi:hypothetical protein
MIHSPIAADEPPVRNMSMSTASTSGFGELPPRHSGEFEPVQAGSTFSAPQVRSFSHLRNFSSGACIAHVLHLVALLILVMRCAAVRTPESVRSSCNFSRLQMSRLMECGLQRDAFCKPSSSPWMSVVVHSERADCEVVTAAFKKLHSATQV